MGKAKVGGAILQVAAPEVFDKTFLVENLKTIAVLTKADPNYEETKALLDGARGGTDRLHRRLGLGSYCSGQGQTDVGAQRYLLVRQEVVPLPLNARSVHAMRRKDVMRRHWKRRWSRSRRLPSGGGCACSRGPSCCLREQTAGEDA